MKVNYRDYYYKYKALKYYLKNNSIEKQIKGGTLIADNNIIQQLENHSKIYNNVWYMMLNLTDFKIYKIDIILNSLKTEEITNFEQGKTINMLIRSEDLYSNYAINILNDLIKTNKIEINLFLIKKKLRKEKKETVEFINDNLKWNITTEYIGFIMKHNDYFNIIHINDYKIQLYNTLDDKEKKKEDESYYNKIF